MVDDDDTIRGLCDATCVGVIGLGAMGGPIARRLDDSGMRVVAWSRSAATRNRFAATSIRFAETPRAVADACSVVFVALPDAVSVREVAFGPDGLAPRGDGMLVDLSTLAPADSICIAEEMGALGWEYIDAPMSGGTAAAESGRLVVMAGATQAQLDRIDAILSVIAAKVVRCGGTGAGQVVKACNQLVVMSTISAVAEAVVVAQSSGIDPAVMRDALLGGLAASPVLDGHGARMLARDFEPGGRVAYNLKDISTLRGIAQSLDLRLPSFDASAAQIERLVLGWGGDVDNAGLIMVVERDAGGGSE